VFLGVSIGSETLDVLAILGAAVTLAGIYIATSKRAGTWARAVMGAGIATDAGPADLPNSKR